LAAARRGVAAVEELAARAHAEAGVLAGRLRIRAPAAFGGRFGTTLTRDSTAGHPGIEIDLNPTDRSIDRPAEGFALTSRIGQLADASLIARRIGQAEAWAVASPAYLDRHPRPARPEDLREHANIRDSNTQNPGRAIFLIEGKAVSIPLPGRITVNSAQAVRKLVLEGEGVA